MCLKLEDGLNRRAPDGGYAKFGPRENLAILGLERSSIAIRRCLASSASTSRPGGPNGDRRPETRTLVSRTQIGASLTFRLGETACAAPP